jgi:hypothetical protein
MRERQPLRRGRKLKRTEVRETVSYFRRVVAKRLLSTGISVESVTRILNQFSTRVDGKKWHQEDIQKWVDKGSPLF